MKIKPKYNFNFFDNDDFNGPTTITFSKDEQCEVIHKFYHKDWGIKNNEVYVIMNKNGETMSISAENCEVIE